jgi:hypothetical protein
MGYTDMGRTSSVSPVSSGIWRVEKKRKTRDKKKRGSGKGQKKAETERDELDLTANLQVDADTQPEEIEQKRVKEGDTEAMVPEYHSVDLKI